MILGGRNVFVLRVMSMVVLRMLVKFKYCLSRIWVVVFCWFVFWVKNSESMMMLLMFVIRNRLIVWRMERKIMC